MKRKYMVLGCLLGLTEASGSELVVNVDGKAGYRKKALAQSVSAVSQKEIVKTSSDRLEDFADYMPGVAIGRSQAGTGSDLFLRGFPLEGQFFLNGLLDKQGYFIRDPATVERVEMFMGADSVMFGSASPGGVVNFVGKKPSFDVRRSIQFETGLPQRARLVYDSTGAVVSQSDWAYRTIVVRQEAETGQKNVGDDRFTLFPSLLYRTDRDELLLEAEFNRQQREYDFDHVFVNGSPVYNVSYVT